MPDAGKSFVASAPNSLPLRLGDGNGLFSGLSSELYSEPSLTGVFEVVCLYAMSAASQLLLTWMNTINLNG